MLGRERNGPGALSLVIDCAEPPYTWCCWQSTPSDLQRILEGTLRVKRKTLLNESKKNAEDFNQAIALFNQSASPPDADLYDGMSADEIKAWEAGDGEPKKPPRPKNVALKVSNQTIIWLDERKYNICPATGAVRDTRRNSYSAEEIGAEIDYDNVMKPHWQANPKRIAVAVKRLIKAKRDKGIEELKAHIQRNDTAPSIEPIKQFLRVLAHPCVTEDAEAFEVACLQLRQLIWNIKQRIWRRPERYIVMPIFWGTQGGAKSKLLNGLFSPLGAFFNPAADMSIFRPGSFNDAPHHDYFVNFFDEMAKPEKVEAQWLKNVMTIDTMTGRGMRMEKSRLLDRNSNYLAATNLPPNHGIDDPTGYRRHPSIRCNENVVEGEYLDLTERMVEPERMLHIWHSVNLNERCPYLTWPAGIHALIEYQNKAMTELFFEKRWLAECCEASPGAILTWKQIIASQSEYARLINYRGKLLSQPDMMKALNSCSSDETPVQMTKGKNIYRLNGVELT